MSTSSTNSAAASPAVSGLDYDDTALTLALPGSSSAADLAAADRKRAHADHDMPPSPKYVSSFLLALLFSLTHAHAPPRARIRRPWTALIC